MEENLGIGYDSQRTKRTDNRVAATDNNVSCSSTILLGAKVFSLCPFFRIILNQNAIPVWLTFC